MLGRRVDERRLKEERDFVDETLKKFGWTRGDLAEEAGISPTTLSRFLAGITRSPHHRTVMNMFASLGQTYLRTLPLPRSSKGKKKEPIAH